MNHVQPIVHIRFGEFFESTVPVYLLADCLPALACMLGVLLTLRTIAANTNSFIIFLMLRIVLFG